jgi:hypothetical protein
MKLLTIVAVAGVITFPAFAQSLARSPGSGDIQAHRLGTPQFNNRATSRASAGPLSAFGAVTPFGSPVSQASRTEREASVRQCNSEAAKTYAVRDSNWSLFAYRACMAQHGHRE